MASGTPIAQTNASVPLTVLPPTRSNTPTSTTGSSSLPTTHSQQSAATTCSGGSFLATPSSVPISPPSPSSTQLALHGAAQTPALSPNAHTSTHVTSTSTAAAAAATKHKLRHLSHISIATWIGVGMAVGALIAAIYYGEPMLRLARWTAMNDFRESCVNDRELGLSSAKCDDTLARASSPPPTRKRTAEVLANTGHFAEVVHKSFGRMFFQASWQQNFRVTTSKTDLGTDKSSMYLGLPMEIAQTLVTAVVIISSTVAVNVHFRQHLDQRPRPKISMVRSEVERCIRGVHHGMFRILKRADRLFHHQVKEPLPNVGDVAELDESVNNDEGLSDDHAPSERASSISEVSMSDQGFDPVVEDSGDGSGDDEAGGDMIGLHRVLSVQVPETQPEEHLPKRLSQSDRARSLYRWHESPKLSPFSRSSAETQSQDVMLGDSKVILTFHVHNTSGSGELRTATLPQALSAHSMGNDLEQSRVLRLESPASRLSLRSVKVTLHDLLTQSELARLEPAIGAVPSAGKANRLLDVQFCIRIPSSVTFKSTLRLKGFEYVYIFVKNSTVKRMCIDTGFTLDMVDVKPSHLAIDQLDEFSHACKAGCKLACRPDFISFQTDRFGFPSCAPFLARGIKILQLADKKKLAILRGAILHTRACKALHDACKAMLTEL